MKTTAEIRKFMHTTCSRANNAIQEFGPESAAASWVNALKIDCEYLLSDLEEKIAEVESLVDLLKAIQDCEPISHSADQAINEILQLIEEQSDD